jgi:hypothetical protein
MQTFRISSPPVLITPAAFMVIGLLMLPVGVVPALQEHGPWQAGLLTLVALGLVTGGISLMRRQIFEIRTADDGTVMFIAPIRTVRVPARDIPRLTGLYIADYSGKQIWHCDIEHARGRYRFEAFEDVMGLVDWVKLHNPDVEICGLWPMGSPEVQGGTGQRRP